MSNEYTAANPDNKIYFLNSRNIVNDLAIDSVVDPIPSLELLNTVNNNLSDGIKTNFPYLSGNNQGEHTISGNNDYIGQHRFEEISVTTEKVDSLSAIQIQSTKNVVTDLTADSCIINTNTSVNFNNVINTDTDLTHPAAKYRCLSNITDSLDKKIYIHGDTLRNYSDLSVVKVKYGEYEKLVVDAHSSGVELDENILYLIQDEYMNAYNTPLCNIVSGGEDAAVPRKYIDDKTNELSTTIDLNRTSDKSELSNVLSTYTNNVSAILSTAIDLNRTGDKSELSNVLSTYTNNVSAVLSSTINSTAAKFSTLSIYNDKVNQALSVSIADISGNIHYASIPTTDFIKDGLLSSVTLANIEGKEYILFKFNIDGGASELSLDIHKLVDVYNSGSGLTLTEDTTGKTFNIDWTLVADKTTQNKLVLDTQTLSSSIKEIYVSNVKNLKFLGEITINAEGYELSSLLKSLSMGPENDVLNGAYIEVFIDGPIDGYNVILSDGTKLWLEHNDKLIIHSHDASIYVSLADLILDDTVYIVRANTTTKFVKTNFPYLSGNNTGEHKISGNNDYIGQHRFEEISATTINANNSVISDLTATNLTATTKLSAVSLSATDLSATKLSAVTLSANNLSATNLTATTKLSAVSLSATDLSATSLSAAGLSATNSLSAKTIATPSLTATNLSAANLTATTKLSAVSLSAATLSANNLSAYNLSATNSLSAKTIATPSLTAANLTATTKISTPSLSATNLSATSLSAAGLSATSLSAAGLSVIDLSAANINGSTLTSHIGTYLTSNGYSTTSYISTNILSAYVPKSVIRSSLSTITSSTSQLTAIRNALLALYNALSS